MRKILGLVILLFLLFIGRDALINSSSYATARIDVSEKTANAAPCFTLIDKNTGKELPEAGWMSKGGNRGYVVEKKDIAADLQINVAADNCKINFSLRGPWELKDKNDRSKGIKKHWVEYTKFTINGKNIVNQNTPAWHNKPIRHTITAPKGENIAVSVAWNPKTIKIYLWGFYIAGIICAALFFLRKDMEAIWQKIKKRDVKSYLREPKFWLITVLAMYLEITYILELINVDQTLAILSAIAALLLNILISVLALRTALNIAEINGGGYCKSPCLYSFIIFLALFCLLLIYHLAYWPGMWCYDVVNNNLLQGLGFHRYNNWHPVLHTFLFVALPGKIFSHPADFIIVQNIWLSLAVAYLFYTMLKYKMFFGAKLYIAYIFVNSLFLLGMQHIIKDSSLCVFAIILWAQYMNIILSEGKWLKSKLNIIFFAAVMVCTGYMRHNAVLLTFPMLLIVCFYHKNLKKAKMLLVFAVVIAVLLVKSLYAHLEVQKPGGRVTETILFPMTIVSNVMKRTPEKLPAQTRDEMYKLASNKVYEVYYIPGNVNSIKWKAKELEKAFNRTEFDKMTYSKAFRYLYESFVYAPSAAWEAFAKLTNIVWSMNVAIRMPNGISENKFGLKANYHPFYHKLVLQLSAPERCKIIKVLYGCVGLFMFIMLAFALAMIARRKYSFVHILPLLTYNLGTMCFLAGPDHRFFFLNIPLWLPVIYLMLADKKGWNKTSDKGENI